MAPSRKDPNFGQLGHLTPEQEKALEDFRSYLVEKGVPVPGDPPIADDLSLLRFLRARQFNLEKTKTMFDNFYKWRKEFDINDLRENFDFPEWREVQKMWPQYFHKTDKDGRPIYYQHCSQYLTKIYKTTTPTKLQKWMILSAEKASTYVLPGADKYLEQEGRKLVEQGLIVMNMEKLSLSQFWAIRDVLREVMQVAQDYYPETATTILVINAPYIFTGIWSLVRPWLDEVTISKVSIHGSDYLPTLLSRVNSLDDIPTCLGGTCKDCEDCRLSDFGPWNPDGKGGLGWEQKMKAKLGETTDGKVEAIAGGNGSVKEAA